MVTMTEEDLCRKVTLRVEATVSGKWTCGAI